MWILKKPDCSAHTYTHMQEAPSLEVRPEETVTLVNYSCETRVEGGNIILHFPQERVSTHWKKFPYNNRNNL